MILSAPRLRQGGRPAGWRRACAALLGGLLLASCGKRGDPLPPLRRTPHPVTNLRVAQHGDRLEVSFVAPRGYADQARLPILEVELFRAEGEGDFDKVARKDRRRVAPGERIVEDEPIPEQPAPATLGGVRLLRFRRRKGSRRGVLMLNAR